MELRRVMKHFHSRRLYIFTGKKKPFSSKTGKTRESRHSRRPELWMLIHTCRGLILMSGGGRQWEEHAAGFYSWSPVRRQWDHVALNQLFFSGEVKNPVRSNKLGGSQKAAANATTDTASIPTPQSSADSRRGRRRRGFSWQNIPKK